MKMKEHLLLMPAESTTSTSAGSDTPAPAAAPAASEPTSTSTESSSVKEGNDDWGSLSDDSDPTPSAPPAAPAAAPAPSAAPPAAAPATTPPAVPPVAAPATPAPTATTPTPAAPTAAPATPAQATPTGQPETPEARATREAAELAAFKAEETKLFGELETYYKLPDDMVAKLATEPELVLPTLAAKVHQAISRGVLNVINTEVPKIVNQIVQSRAVEQAAKDNFYGKWPALRKHEAQVLQVGAMFRQLNPNATEEQFVSAVGKIVSESLGIAIAAPAASPGNGVQQPAQQPVFRPAGTQGSNAGAAPASDNEFTALAMEEC